MRQLFFIIISLFPFAIGNAQSLPGTVTRQTYYLEKAPDAPGVYMQTAYKISGISTTEKTQTIKMIDAAVEAVKKVYPQPIGAHIGIYSGITENYIGVSEFKNGPYRIYITIPFYDLYKTSSGGIEASGEYASGIDVRVNNINYMLQVNPVKYGNGRIYREPKPGIAVNGFSKYNNMVLVIPAGKSLPWRRATKQEYLDNYIEGLKNSLPGRSSTAAERQKIPDAEQILASMSSAEKKEIAYLKKMKYNNAQTGFSDFESYNWAGFSNASDTTAEQLVIIDENFYDKTLLRSSFQVIVIERRWPRASSNNDESNSNSNYLKRLNGIVQSKDFLPELRNLLGRDGLNLVNGKPKKKSIDKYVFHRPSIKNIDWLVDSAMKTYKYNPPVTPSITQPTTSDVPLPNLPKINSKKILLASRKLETKEEVISYIDSLDKKISTALSESVAGSYEDAATNDKASYGYWLANKPGQALLLAIKAAKQEPENHNVLNNLGATLSLCGIDYLAIPIYIVCIKKESNNSTLNNNIGQAWLQLGDMNKAEYYLKMAVAKNNYHHHANNSLGTIYEMQGRKSAAIECYKNSLRGSFTLYGYRRLRKLDYKAAMKLLDYVRPRYKQPEYVNFDKYIPPLQCTQLDQTEIRKAQFDLYEKTIYELIKKYNKLYNEQEPVAENSLKKIFLSNEWKKKILQPFHEFAKALLVSASAELSDKRTLLEKDLFELEKNRLKLEIEYDTAMKEVDMTFEPRVKATGEGNADLKLEEEICAAKTEVCNFYLPRFAEINEERYNKIIHAYKDYLNDYLYWLRFADYTEEVYRLHYYNAVSVMFYLLAEVRITTLDESCLDREDLPTEKPKIEIEEPHCPLPVGIEIPFVIGKIVLDCEGYGIDVGEILKLTIDHKIGRETTIAFGAGLSFYTTPEIFGKKKTDFHPGLDASAKGQAFVTIDGNNVMDWGLLWEAEVDAKGIGKPAELKQDFVWSINKGFYAEGALSHVVDKIFDVPPEKPVNKKVKIYKPQ